MDKVETNSPDEHFQDMAEEVNEPTRKNIVLNCEEGTMSCPDCDGSGKCQRQNGEG